MRCREESEASSMIHRGALSGRVTGSVPSVTSQERRLSFNSPELIQGGTQATPRVKTARISWKSLALARSHPPQTTLTSPPTDNRIKSDSAEKSAPPFSTSKRTSDRIRPIRSS